MATSRRPDYKINLDGLGQLSSAQARSANTSATNSPLEPPSGNGLRYPLNNSINSNGGLPPVIGRAGAGSPSKEFTSRLFSKRAREIQAQEGLNPQVWGPPPTGSGHSTPLRETIPESPISDNFPDFDGGQSSAMASPQHSATLRRARAGTVPSRFPGIGSLNNSTTSLPSQHLSRPTSNTNLHQSMLDSKALLGGQPITNASLLSRLRAGSLPQKTGVLNSNPFGNSLFASNWMAGRERASTLQSIRSSDAPSSPRELSGDNDVRTLDYLGLIESPITAVNNLLHADADYISAQQLRTGQTIADLAALNLQDKKSTNSRFRSFSVNATEKYADGDDDSELYDTSENYYASGQLTPAAEGSAAHAAAIREAVRRHNLDVQAFANFASAHRPRARTAGMLDSPSSHLLRNYLPTPSRLDNSISATDYAEETELDLSSMNNPAPTVGPTGRRPGGVALDGTHEAPTRALWLGNIPASTTVSSLNVIFGQFGPVEFARILTHKSCGFVNFENLEDAVAAKAHCNGKELFPGCGPVRIGFAKEQPNTPAAPVSYSSGIPVVPAAALPADALTSNLLNVQAGAATTTLVTPSSADLVDDMLSIVQHLGASQEELGRTSKVLDFALQYNDYQPAILPIPESSHNRVHDGPRLREIKKRIDNHSYTPIELETVAMEMLPEIAELSSDYLGNTIVQKLFVNCSEDIKDKMLAEIAPHLAEIGAHKNGTWAAQKIIEVARTPRQIELIVEALRPHGVNLFLDQYGNYVMQGCLHFGSASNNFLFDTMLNRLWDVAQNRYGARAIRGCLESEIATDEQRRAVAAAIALHSALLATNSNGALLLTWYLDTCVFPRRRSVLALRLIPNLVQLCTHRVAYLTVLKIINQPHDAEARDSILQALFFEEEILLAVVSDPECGATFLFKVLITPHLDKSIRPRYLERVRKALDTIQAQPKQGYKRLIEEVSPDKTASDSRSSSKPRNGYLGGLPNGHQAYDRGPTSVQGIPFTHSSIDAQLQYPQGLLAALPTSRDIYSAPGTSPIGQNPYANNAGQFAQSAHADAYRHSGTSNATGTSLGPPGLPIHGQYYPQQQVYGAVAGMPGYPMSQYQSYDHSAYQPQRNRANGGSRRGRVSLLQNGADFFHC